MVATDSADVCMPIANTTKAMEAQPATRILPIASRAFAILGVLQRDSTIYSGILTGFMRNASATKLHTHPSYMHGFCWGKLSEGVAAKRSPCGLQPLNPHKHSRYGVPRAVDGRRWRYAWSKGVIRAKWCLEELGWRRDGMEVERESTSSSCTRLDHRCLTQSDEMCGWHSLRLCCRIRDRRYTTRERDASQRSMMMMMIRAGRTRAGGGLPCRVRVRAV